MGLPQLGRADKAHRKLLALGYAGSERTTRRAVTIVKKDYPSGRIRVHRAWVTEPGMWIQYDQPEVSSIPAPTEQALHSLEWIGRRENLVVCGPSGTG